MAKNDYKNDDILTPRKTGEYIVKNAKHVKVNEEGLKSLTQVVLDALLHEHIQVANFAQHELHPNKGDKNAVEWIFVVDTLNFSFWTPRNKKSYIVNGYTGYFALCAAINRAIIDGFDMLNPEFYSTIDLKTMEHIFRSDHNIRIPMLEERHQCLHEVGQILLEKWNGKFENILRLADHSAVKLLEIVVQEFPCFRDEAIYAEKRVSFYKRAQILIGDLWCYFQGQTLGDFYDIHCITMFADYRVPQVLVYFKALEYSDELMEVLKSNETLSNGDLMELEIRGASIYIVEKITNNIREILTQQYPNIPLSSINSILVDMFLWEYRRKHSQLINFVPFHQVRCIFY